MDNAGWNLWKIQKRQRTGLCFGLDFHYDPESGLNAEFYKQFANEWGGVFKQLFWNQMRSAPSEFLRPIGTYSMREDTVNFLAGITSYFMNVITAAWESGIRVYKPQISFLEKLHPYGMTILEIICVYLEKLSVESSEPFFNLLDAKRTDTEMTMRAYYQTYLSDLTTEVMPGVGGRFNVDAITVTMPMGLDVLTAGLPYFKAGKGAAVVTRSSNPSGVAFQDLIVLPNTDLVSTSRDDRRLLTDADYDQLEQILGEGGGGAATIYETIAYMTQKFSDDHELNQEGVSPLFSVMGSTEKIPVSFRLIRPTGIALIPGFGPQGGTFENIMPLVIPDGPLAGHLGIISVSRYGSCAWMRTYGGKGHPELMASEVRRAVSDIRAAEKKAYENANAFYPF